MIDELHTLFVWVKSAGIVLTAYFDDVLHFLLAEVPHRLPLFQEVLLPVTARVEVVLHWVANQQWVMVRLLLATIDYRFLYLLTDRRFILLGHDNVIRTVRLVINWNFWIHIVLKGVARHEEPKSAYLLLFCER